MRSTLLYQHDRIPQDSRQAAARLVRSRIKLSSEKTCVCIWVLFVVESCLAAIRMAINGVACGGGYKSMENCVGPFNDTMAIAYKDCSGRSQNAALIATDRFL
jgi:hypothetical protein